MTTLLRVTTACGYLVLASVSCAGDEANDEGDGRPDPSRIPAPASGVDPRPEPFSPGVPDAALGLPDAPMEGGLTLAPCEPLVAPCEDIDGDGRGEGCAAGADCADDDPTRFQGAPEILGDGVDQDCDGADLPLDDASAVHVVAGAADTNAGTRAAPVGTVAKGIELAMAGGATVVVVAEGTYVEDIVASASIVGGYDPVTWTRDPASRATLLTSARLEGSRQAFASVQVTAGVEVAGPAACSGCGGIVVSETSIGAGGGAAVPLAITFDRAIVHRTSVTGLSYGVGVQAPAGLSVLLSEVDVAVADGWAVTLDGGRALVRGSDVTSARTAVLVPAAAAAGTTLEIRDSVLTAHRGIEAYAGDVLVARSRIVGAAGSRNSTFGVDARGANVVAVNNFVSSFAPALRDVTGVACTGGTLFAVHNTIVVGDASHRVAGFDLGCSASVVSNVVLVGQSASGSASAIAGSGPVALLHNLLEPATTACLAEESCVGSTTELDACEWTGCAAAAGNVAVDPGLVDRTTDPHLSTGSPAIDSALDLLTALTPPGIPCVTDDLDGEPRPAGGGFDIGADEAR